MRIAEELDIAHLEDHVQRQSLARLLENRQRPRLLHAESRDDALVGEPREAAHVVRIPLAVHPRLPAGTLLALAEVLEVEDGLARPLLLALRHLALAVKVPHRLGQQLGHIRVLPLQGVPDVVDADNVALAALGGPVHAQEADQVAIVGMEELPRGGAVDAHLINLCWIVADVLDVAEDVTTAVLADEIA